MQQFSLIKFSPVRMTTKTAKILSLARISHHAVSASVSGKIHQTSNHKVHWGRQWWHYPCFVPFATCSMKFCTNFVPETNVQRPGDEVTSPWERGGVSVIPLVEGQGRQGACSQGPWCSTLVWRGCRNGRRRNQERTHKSPLDWVLLSQLLSALHPGMVMGGSVEKMITNTTVTATCRVSNNS